MKTLIKFVALAIVAAVLTGGGGWKKGGIGTDEKEGKWVVGKATAPVGSVGSVESIDTPTVDGGLVLKYNKPANEAEKIIIDILKEAKIFEELISGLNDTFSLPVNVPVVFKNCGTVNAFYDPNDGTISICYELLTYFLAKFSEDDEATDEEIGENVIYATIFTFLHEMGHAMVDVMELPVLGREEDVVDDLATVFSLELGEGGEKIAYSAMSHFASEAEAWGEEDELPFWDEHSLDAQRVYSIACILYGSDPEAYKDLVGEDGLPEERAERCPDEYELKSRSWEALLGPYMK